MAEKKEKDDEKEDGKKTSSKDKKSVKSTASSESQRKLAGLALAVKKGRVDDSEVTSNVRDMAADMSTSDLRAMASKPEGKKKLPDKVTPEKKDKDMKEATVSSAVKEYRHESPTYTTPMKYTPAPPPESLGGREEDEYTGEPFGGDRAEFDPKFDRDEAVHPNLNLYDIIGKYNEYGRALRRDHTMSELAQQLSDIAEAAEYHLTSEANDWYDSHTISRNIKEMQGYAKEFSKLAQEADEYNVRMEALYEDMGRVLERYFEIYPDEAAVANEVAPQHLPQPELTKTNPLAVSPPTNLNMMNRDTTAYSLPPKINEITNRAIVLARGKLKKEDVEIFDRLPIVRKVMASWRILSENRNG